MDARMRRIQSDWEQIQKDFDGHEFISVKPIGPEPPEKYLAVYFVNGIYLLPDGTIETLNRHEVEITLHADYPRYKPLCKILTPIWHPNFRDGQVCIGDIWGAGESLSDIIINIGDMIQYKSWNSFSPLSADAAKWAIENKHLFPVGNADLYPPDHEALSDSIEIDLFDDDDIIQKENSAENNTENIVYSLEKESSENNLQETENLIEEEPKVILDKSANDNEIDLSKENILNNNGFEELKKEDIIKENDFEITADELQGIEFVPTAQRMQNLSGANIPQGNGINFKTIFFKGILWGLAGGIIGWILQEVFKSFTDAEALLRILYGYSSVENFYRDAYYAASNPELIIMVCIVLSSSIFSAIIACCLGMFMGLGEGVYYGSSNKAVKYLFIGGGISIVIGFISGMVAQMMFSAMMRNGATGFAAAFIRGIGWSVMGLGIGFAAGIIKPQLKRICFCSVGGLIGGFLGGLLFNYIAAALSLGSDDTGVFARAVGIVIMGGLIGLCIGTLEQFAKSAWLKVIRGEFEGKEYLVFSGTTSIGNDGSNTIVLFKDKLVGQHHCDIVLEGGQYFVVDKGTPMGTFVNGAKVNKKLLRRGDAISVGNTLLVFNTK